MYRLTILLITFLPYLNAAFGQNFISLDWEHPSPCWVGEKTADMGISGFSGAQYDADTGLPYYTYSTELGFEYSRYDYEVKIEYPEYSPLSKKEIKVIKERQILLPHSPEVRKRISISSGSGILSAVIVPFVHIEGEYLRVNSFKLSILKKEKEFNGRRLTNAKRIYAESSVLSSGRWVKIRIPESGIYKITAVELQKMGFSNLDKVKLYGYGGRILSEDLSESKIDDLQEIPLWRESGYVLFYGYGTLRWVKNDSKYKHVQNHYSVYGCYFLTEGGTEPMEFPVENSLPEENARKVTTFPDYALYEKEEFAWLEGGRKLFDSYDYKNGNTQSYTFNLKGITTDRAFVSVAFSAYDKEAATTLSVSVNGNPLPDIMNISRISEKDNYNQATISEKDFVWDGDKTEKAIVTLTHKRNSKTSGHLDFIRINYMRNLALYDSHMIFRPIESGKMSYVIEQANLYTCVWDVSDAGNYKQMKGTLSDGKYVFTCNSSETDEYVVLNPKADFKKVEVVGEVANQNLHRLAGVDMIIITPPNAEMIKQAQKLADAHKRHDELQTEIVTSEQIYNEFSSGTPDATAYRWLMKMLYDRAGTGDKPKYLLLFGDSSFDNRLITSNWTKFSQNDLLLCYESVNSVSTTNSFVADDYFGVLDDEENTSQLQNCAVDIGIGRIPVRTATQAKEVVEKLIAYMENKHAGAWKNKVAFLADDGKNDPTTKEGNIHMQQADNMAAVFNRHNPSALIEKIYWDAYKMERTATGDAYPEVKKRILELFEEGLLFMNYCGHGGPSSFSDEYVLTTADVDKLSSPKAPLWFTAACDIAPFDHIDESMGERALLNPKGGAIGLMTTARTVFGGSNGKMDSIFIRFLFNNDCPRIGDAVRKAKAHISSVSPAINNLQFVFLGDPALRLAVPDYKMVVDEFNGKTSSDELPIISAGGKITVKGRVLDAAGNTAEDFNGKVCPTVMDSEEKITTYNNNQLASSPFVYYDRTKTLFAGSDSVRAGVFEFCFPVPLDINYSDEKGLLNLYAVSNGNRCEGSGVFTDFLIGGTEDGAMNTDSLGPDMHVYLNSPDFISGDRVNTTPYLVAKLEDEDGINTIGSGIGHDIIAVIDNSSEYTFILNNYYEAEFGDYRKGTVQYSLPELSAGKHTLLFRAWDIKNNSSTVSLDFNVVERKPVELAEVICIEKDGNATFIIKHDRPNSELNVKVSVYDCSGRSLWMHEENGTSSDNYYYVNWNRATSSGQKLVKGVYLYQITVVSGNSESISKADKIVF